MAKSHAIGRVGRIRPGGEHMKTIVGLGLGTILGLMAAATRRAEDDRVFVEKVAAILERRCVRCHGGDSPKGKLSLTTRAGALKGGASGPAIVPGRPDESLLAEMIAGEAPEMP